MCDLNTINVCKSVINDQSTFTQSTFPQSPVRPYVIKQNRQLKCACGIRNKVNEPAHKHCGQRNKGSNKYLLRVDKTVQGIFNCIDDNKL